MKKKRDIWKETHWDKWTLSRKVLHVLAVIGALAISICMWLAAVYIVLVVFGIQGFLLKLRDTVLLEIMHYIFG